MKALKGIAWGLLGVVSVIVFLAIIGAITGTPDDEEQTVSGCSGFVIPGGEFATLTKSAFEQRLREAGCSDEQIANSLATFDQDKARQARWTEQWDHWANVDAFTASVNEINADRVVDADELLRICFVLDQWKAQMTEARDYVVDYRKADAVTVEKNPGLQNLQAEAERALALLTEIQCP